MNAEEMAKFFDQQLVERIKELRCGYEVAVMLPDRFQRCDREASQVTVLPDKIDARCGAHRFR